MIDATFEPLSVLVCGDQTEDELIIGTARRMSRESPGLPVVDVTERGSIAGGACNVARQVRALGGEPFLVTTGPPCLKSRLIVEDGGVTREVARFDSAWPSPDPLAFHQLQRDAEVMTFRQYRPGRPSESILADMRRHPATVKVGDVQAPAYFAGVLNVVKLSVADAWRNLARPAPPVHHDTIRAAALSFCRSFGFELVVITAGRDGYHAAHVDGVTISGKGIADHPRSVAGAGDVFTATLAMALASRHERRDALALANIAAGLGVMRPIHLPSITAEDMNTWISTSFHHRATT